MGTTSSRPEATSPDRTGSPLELRLDEPGTLTPPGPAGRLVRLGWGLLLALSTYTVWMNPQALTGWSFPLQPLWWVGGVALLSVLPYIVNIGFGVAWRAWPRNIVIGIMLVWIAANLFLYGSVWSPSLGWFVVAWQLYAMIHLGGSFLLAAAIATPGCEMRALPHLWTLLTGRATKEHYCPGHIDTVDKWEGRRAS